MRILIFGAGAVGGCFGGLLARHGVGATLVARGAQYEALAGRGIVLEGARSGQVGPVRVAVCRPGEERPPYDLVFVALKAHQIAGCAAHLVRLIGRDGAMIFAQNGLPWWYFEKLDSPYRGTRLPSLDADGALAATIPVDAIIGGVAYRPADLVEPGFIRYADQPTDQLVIGELDNRLTPRLEAIAQAIGTPDWPVTVTTDIRGVKWKKLLANAVYNPLGAIAQSTARQVVMLPAGRRLAAAMLDEVFAVAGALGIRLDTTVAGMLEYAETRAGLPSSTLQDVRAGRVLELDALLNALIDIARLTATPVPALEHVAACANLLNQRIIEDGIAIRPVPA
jgi:2-dehydropantoate 2-reductase